MMIRQRIYEIIEIDSKNNGKANSVFSWFLIILIWLNVAAVIVGSINEMRERFYYFFAYFELFSIVVFSLEYLLRVWAAPCKYQKMPYFHYIFSFMGIIDLLAIVPFLLPYFINSDLRVLRIFRIFRLLRILKLARYNNAFEFIGRVLKTQKEKLVITIFFMLMMILIASSVMYFAENAVQPEKFPNIPATMWWAIATLTTVGYGDVYPVTILGRIFGAVIAILGIGLIAMPSGIISMGMVEEVRKKNG
jgi:voltage-gated potassium channel